MRWACLALVFGASDGGHPKALGRDEDHKGARIGKPAHNMCDEDLERGCWPRLWLLGAQKSGSCSLFNVMEKSLGVCGAELTGPNAAAAKYFHKETHYWEKAARQAERGANATGDGWDYGDAAHFTRLYPRHIAGLRHCRNGFVEATPNNLVEARVPALLRGAVPAKFGRRLQFIAVLREPVARDLSAFNHQRHQRVDWLQACPATRFRGYEAFATCQLAIWRSNGANVSRVFDALRYGLWAGLYGPQLDAWSAAFGRKDLLVLESRSMLANPRATTALVASFLRVPHGDAQRAKVKAMPVINAQDDGKKQRTISCATRDGLGAVFDPYNEALYAALDDARRSGRAPDVEPPFPRFPKFPCEDRAARAAARPPGLPPPPPPKPHKAKAKPGVRKHKRPAKSAGKVMIKAG